MLLGWVEAVALHLLLARKLQADWNNFPSPGAGLGETIYGSLDRLFTTMMYSTGPACSHCCREQMKNDLRVEMQTAAKLAALETAARTNPGMPMVVNSNSTNMQAAGPAAPGGAPTTVVVVGPQRRERFCGPLSCLIWFFFPVGAACAWNGVS